MSDPTPTPNNLSNLIQALDYLDEAISLLQTAETTAFPLNIAKYIEAGVTYLNYIFEIQSIETICVSGDKQCLIDKLAEYGVTIAGSYPGLTLPTPIDQFTEEQLLIILNGLQHVGKFFALSVSLYYGEFLTPQEAFKRLFSPIKIYMNLNDSWARTDQTTFAPTFYIQFVPSSFTIFPPVDITFVVVHELGHVFHFRQSSVRESQLMQDYADAISAYWTPFNNSETSNEPFDIEVNNGTLSATYDSANNVYYIPQGTYFTGDGNYSQAYINVSPFSLFPNEVCTSDKEALGRCHPNKHPMEGLSDSFANLIINPEFVPSNEPRRVFMLSEMFALVVDILSNSTS